MTANTEPVSPWPVLWACDVRMEGPTITGAAVQAATNILWAMSGQRFGTNQVTLRPCLRDCMPTSFPGHQWDPWPGVGWGTLLYGGGSWGWGAVGTICGGCGVDCSCSSISQIMLPHPVSAISQVKLDGAVLNPASYRLDNSYILARIDGGIWPSCQNLNLADTQAGTFSVTALYGEDVPADAQWAVGELACQFIRAWHGEDCSLPANLTALTQQGVTISLPDLSTALRDRSVLGLRLCDLFIQRTNPARITQRARAYSVDRQAYRRTGT